MDSPDLSPFIHQDLMSYNNGIMPNLGNPFMPVMAPTTNLLGGTRMAAQPDNDVFQRMQQRNKKERNIFIKSLIALAAIGGSAMLVFKGKMNFKNLGNAIAAPFKWFGKQAKKGGNAVVSGSKQGAKYAGGAIGRGFGKLGKGLKSLGKSITKPFKWAGKQMKKLGHGIAAPFKWIGAQSKKAFHAMGAPFRWIGGKFKKKP